MQLRRRQGLAAPRAAAAIAIALCAAAGARCSRPGEPGRTAPAPDAARAAPVAAVATVNGEPIPAEAVRRELARASPADAPEGSAGAPDAGASVDAARSADAGDGADAAGAAGEVRVDPAVRRRALDGLVDRALLLQEARARGIEPPAADVDRAVAGLRQDYPGAHLDELLARQGTSEAELRARLREQLTLERLLAAEVFPAVAVSDDEVARWYAEHASDFQLPAQVHALQIVARTRDEARKLREEVRRRPDRFAEVARRASIAPEAAGGGDLGWFGKGSGMPEAFDVCLGMKPGAISDVVASPYGFHVFKVIGRRPASRRPLAEVREGIRERLLRDRRAEAQERHVAALRAKARIDVDAAALERLAP